MTDSCKHCLIVFGSKSDLKKHLLPNQPRRLSNSFSDRLDSNKLFRQFLTQISGFKFASHLALAQRNYPIIYHYRWENDYKTT